MPTCATLLLMLCRPFAGTEYQDRAVRVGAKVFKTRLRHIPAEIRKFEDMTATFLRALAQRSVLEEAFAAGGKAHHRQWRFSFHGAADLAQSEDRVGEVVQRSCTDGGVEQASPKRQRLHRSTGEVNLGNMSSFDIMGAPPQHAHADINTKNGP